MAWQVGELGRHQVVSDHRLVGRAIGESLVDALDSVDGKHVFFCFRLKAM